MNILNEIRSRFATALAPLIDDPARALEQIRPSQNPQHGDYQANCAMPLSGQLKKPSREIAQQLVDHLKIADLADPPEIAGPGFVNIRLRNDWLQRQIQLVGQDKRLGIEPTTEPKTYVVDYSSPNVAKPMHVGHLRTTVIGDSLCRTLRFLGHHVISDNHLGDWGTQFGMIIYGYRNFVDPAAYEKDAVEELGRIYKYVRRIIDYHENLAAIPRVEQQVQQLQDKIAQAKDAPPAADKKAEKKASKALRRLEDQLNELTGNKGVLATLRAKIARAEADPHFLEACQKHANIGSAVLQETAKLHAGDADNLQLWHDFLPKCREDIQKIYHRLDISFDYELGESFYHDQLGKIVDEFKSKGMARESEGANCVFLDDFDAPMIIQKKDGAYLYATTDLATIKYRMDTWKPDAILYVVDFRQGEHFDKLFATAKKWGYDSVELRHVKFGTVLGPDGRPYKTREGDTVGLIGLLDVAVGKAHKIVCENDDAKKGGPELSDDERHQIADTIGHAAIKYADLSHNRASDYVYHEDKMVALRGNTATYMQYSFARTQAILARHGKSVVEKWSEHGTILLSHEKERSLALTLLRFSEAIDDVLVDYEPNLLTAYLFELAGQFSSFYDACPVLKADTEQQKISRLLLCDLVGRTLKIGLSLLGIKTVDRM